MEQKPGLGLVSLRQRVGRLGFLPTDFGEDFVSCTHRFRQKEGLLECGWEGSHMGVIIYSFNLNISPKMSYGVLECDIAVLQNYMPMIL